MSRHVGSRSEPRHNACAVPNTDVQTVHAAEPSYSDIAREQGAVGTPKVKVSPDASGNILDATIAKSAGNAALDASALAAARASTFAPAIVDCAPRAGSFYFSADFHRQ